MSLTYFEIQKTFVIRVTVSLKPGRVSVNGRPVFDIPVVPPGGPAIDIDLVPHLRSGKNDIHIEGFDKPIRVGDEQEDFEMIAFLDGKNLASFMKEEDVEATYRPDESFEGTLGIDFKGAQPPAATCSIVFHTVDDQARVLVGGTEVHKQNLLFHTQPAVTFDLTPHLKPGTNDVEVRVVNLQHLSSFDAELFLGENDVDRWKLNDFEVNKEAVAAAVQLSRTDEGITLVP